jgi:integral membrane protein (TIGR01906 family)
MKILKTVAFWLFILCIPVLLVTATVRIASNSTELYNFGFNKYNVSGDTGISSAELYKAAEGLIAYFNNGEKYIDLTVIKDGKPFTLFTQREIEHLKDVKGLFRLVYRLLLGTLIYAMIYAIFTYSIWRDRRRLAWGLIGGSGLTLGLVALLGVAIGTNFDQFFYDFHLISFTNNLWQLDPTDYLIRLFPQGFWYDAALIVTIGTAALALIMGFTGWWRLRHLKDTKETQPSSPAAIPLPRSSEK